MTHTTQTEIIPEIQMHEKTAERDNRRNCQQIYLSTTPKQKRDKTLVEEGAGITRPGFTRYVLLTPTVSELYEISPYATFSVGDGERLQQSRSVTTSTLDYNVQFKTFGHLENEDALIAKGHTKGKHSWSKHRYYNTGTAGI